MFINYNSSWGPGEPSSESRDASSEIVNNSPHILMVPHPSFLHVSVMFAVAKQLVIRARNIKVTILSFDSVINSLTSNLRNPSGRIHFLRLREDFSCSPYPVANDGGNQRWGMEDEVRRLEQASRGYIIKCMMDKEHGVRGRPTFLVSDLLHLWTNEISDKLEIPRFVMCSISACSLALALAFREVGGYEQLVSRDLEKIDVEKVKVDRLPPFTINEMCMRDPEFVRNVEKSISMATGIIVNTFEELETEALQAIRRRIPDTCELLPIGPILIAETVPPVSSDTLCVTEECLQYLVKIKSKKSVVFVNLGTPDMHKLSTRHLHQLAYGLEDSGERFLWVLQIPVDVKPEEVLPEGFQYRMRERGLVIRGWVSLMEILSNRCIAAFLTDANWNSCLQSIITGIPIIAIQSFSDRLHNARYFAEILKVALQVYERENFLVHRLDIYHSIHTMFTTSVGFLLKDKGMDLKMISMIVCEYEGSSYRNLERLFQLIVPS